MMEPAMLMASYAAWRMTYQDAEQAAKAAYFKAHEHAMKLDAKDAEIAALRKEVDKLNIRAGIDWGRNSELTEMVKARRNEIAALKAKLAAWDKAAIEVGYCHEAEGHNPVAVDPKTMAESVLMERDQKEPLYEEISDLRDKLEEAERRMGEAVAALRNNYLAHNDSFAMVQGECPSLLRDHHQFTASFEAVESAESFLTRLKERQ